ncbi:HVO_A0114 family putative DNA-binding protein [Caballeronia sp. KNU42]
METVTLGVASREAVNNRFLDAFAGTAQGPHITFESAELLFQVLTQRRWNIVSSITAAGPVSIPEIARRVRRDVKAVDRDVRALLNAGIVAPTADGAIVIPYAAVRVDFVLTATRN